MRIIGQLLTVGGLLLPDADLFIQVKPAGCSPLKPPARFAVGADAVQTFEAKANTLLAQAQAHRELSASLAHDDV